MNGLLLRRGLATFVALDLVALGLLSVQRTTRTVTTSTSAPVAAPTVETPASAPSTVVLPAGASTPYVVPGSTVPGTAPVPATTAPTAPPSSGAPPTGTGPTAPAAQPCPVPLQTPARSGGLQSLIAYAPAFGPFTAEAFAGAAAYQPALQLVGPILAQYPTLAPTVEPALAPFVTAAAQLEQQGYAVVGPGYAPYRPQVIAAETQLATAVAPWSQAIAGSALASCAVDLEAALVGDTKKKSGNTTGLPALPATTRG